MTLYKAKRRVRVAIATNVANPAILPVSALITKEAVYKASKLRKYSKIITNLQQLQKLLSLAAFKIFKPQNDIFKNWHLLKAVWKCGAWVSAVLVFEFLQSFERIEFKSLSRFCRSSPYICNLYQSSYHFYCLKLKAVVVVVVTEAVTALTTVVMTASVIAAGKIQTSKKQCQIKIYILQKTSKNVKFVLYSSFFIFFIIFFVL